MIKKSFIFSICLFSLLIGFSACKTEVEVPEPTYTVTYNLNGYSGESPDKLTGVKKGYKLTEKNLPELTREGYEFKGWVNSKNELVTAGYEVTENLVLTASWNAILPGAVTNLAAELGDGKVTLSWTNPTDDNLKKIKISCEPAVAGMPVEITENVTSGKDMTYEITGLEATSAYTFTVKTESEFHESAAETCQVGAYKTATSIEGLYKLHSGYSGTAGTKWTYVAFGMWPQTKYSGTAGLTPCGQSINGWEQDVCFTDGTDNYIKVTATPDETCSAEYTANNQYYFKLEPIVWRVLTDDYITPESTTSTTLKNTGRKLLFAEKALAVEIFNKTETCMSNGYSVYTNNYDKSDIRKFLNNDFMNKAFTGAQKKAISTTVVDNSEGSTKFSVAQLEDAKNYGCICSNTEDKIFLLSIKEVMTKDYGFIDSEKSNEARKRKLTDYTKAIGIRDYKGQGISHYWLRTPWYSQSYSYYIGVDGSFDWQRVGTVDTDNLGVVPALSISF